MGTILHTGDFRFNPKMIYENPILFPRETTKEIFKLSDEADYDKAIMMNCH
jgi:mRNA degradation ribonuclease J1/J2